MAGEMVGQRQSASERSVQGLGFAAGIYLAYDCMSTLNSSPWTHQTFGSDPSKKESAQYYVRLAISSSTALSVLTGFVMGDISPVLGCAVANLQLFLVYRRAGNLASKGE